MSNHKKWNVFANGILNENPVLVLVLGINCLSSFIAGRLAKK